MLAARGGMPVADITDVDPGSLPYRRVSATGAFDPSHEIVVSGRSLNGVAGNHVLTPLVLDDGSAVLVDRGWVPLDVAQPPVGGVAATIEGTVTVTGVVLPPDAISNPPLSPAPAVVNRIDLGLGGLPYDLAPVFLLLQSQAPPQAGDLPVPASAPTLDEGPHLSYAIQWFAFAAIALVGYAALLRRESRARYDGGSGR